LKENRKLKSILSNFNNNIGVTLIELIIVLAIIGIVINVSFSMNIFGVKSFAKGSNRYDLNTKTNLVSEYITKSIRYAYSVEILSSSYTIPESTTIASSNPNDAYIFISNVAGEKNVNYRDRAGTKTLGEFNNCSLLVKHGDSTNNYDKSISYTLTTGIRGESFSVDSSVVPINLLIQDNPEIIDNTGTADGVALKIKNISPTVTNIEELIFGAGNPPNGQVGNSYSFAFSVSNGISPYTFHLSEATKLPAGMALSNTGILNGIPLEAGSFTFVVGVNDGSTPSKDGSKYFNINIANKDGVIIDSTAPIVSNVNITKPGGINENRTSVNGIELTADYQYIDPNDKVESGSTFSWWISANDNGTGLNQITGATSKTYSPLGVDVSKFLYVKVIPSNGSKTGNGVFCEFPIRIVASGENSKPIAREVTIIRSNVNDEILTGDYVYVDGGKIEGLSKYKWFRSKKEDDTPQVIVGETSKSLKVTDNSYKIYYFEVTPVSSVGGIVGDTVRSLFFTFNPK